MFEITPVREHFEVFYNGKFFCSADTESEAKQDIEEFLWLSANLEESIDMC